MGDELLIKETKYWKIFLSPGQAYLGRCKIPLKRHCGDLSELSSEEWQDFISLVKNLEASLKKSFSPSNFNWTCLMNYGFWGDTGPREGTGRNPHIHWHFRPRYEQVVEFGGLSFEDKEFGFHYVDESVRDRTVPDDVMAKILQKIRKKL